MTNETRFTDSLTFVDLEKSAMDWARIILSKNNDARSNKVNAYMFDILKQAQIIESAYIHIK